MQAMNRWSVSFQNSLPACSLIAAASSLLGRDPEARHAVGQLKRLAPRLSEENLRSFLGGALLDRYLEGLRGAGWAG